MLWPHVFRVKRVPLRSEAADVHIDHHAVGHAQELWLSHKYAPGAPFFLPSGAHIYNKLIALMRGECLARWQLCAFTAS